MNEEKFEKYYRQNLHQILVKFDKKKAKVHWLRLLNLLMTVGVFLVFFFVVDWQGGEFNAWLLLVLVPIGGLIWGVNKRYHLRRNLRHEYKTNVVEQMVKMIDPSLEYNYKARISDNEFRKSGIFRQRIDRSRGEDLIQGMLDKTQIMFSELKMEYKTVTHSSKGGRREQWHTFFNGVFLIADFNKHFNVETYVLPDRWERLLGRFARKLQKMGTTNRGKLVQLENVEFEKYFRVFSYDQIEARYILTPAMMERIVSFRKKARSSISLSFVDSKLYLAIPLRQNLFEPRWYGKNASLKYTLISFNYLLLFTGIVDELKLNTRIWSKR